MNRPAKARLTVPGVTSIRWPRRRSTPSGYMITVDRRCMVDAGKEGVIRDRDIASMLRDFLQLSNPHADVKAFEVYELTP